MAAADKVIQELYRAEFAKMVAVVARRFALTHIEVAEDIVSETFLTAAEKWKDNGVPANPPAWLYAVARQKALMHFRRTRLHNAKIAELGSDRDPGLYLAHHEFSAPEIRDSQLAMLFAVCNPCIQSEAQIGLALRILCGFGIDEIAEAFFSNKETINKRLFRAKEKLRAENVAIDLPPADEIPARLDAVLRIIYLLFNEGYYSRTQNETLRRDFCFEALRLGTMLAEYAPTNRPQTNALIALMCFHASRFDARESDNGVPVLYEEQNASLWNRGLIAQGAHYLSSAATGDELTTYHLEAGIAYWHCIKEDTPEKWRNILDHYDRLLQLQYSPVAELNRIYALARVSGKAIALARLDTLSLPEDRFYHVLAADLCQETDTPRARLHLEKALHLARTESERESIVTRMAAVLALNPSP